MAPGQTVRFGLRVVRLHVRAEGGGWRLWLSDAGAAPSSAFVPEEIVTEIRQRADEVLVPGAVLIRGHDLPLVRRERPLGQTLARALAAPGVGEAWQRVLGEAGGEGVALALWSEDAAIADLPWELLAASPQEGPLEERGSVVARLGRGAREPRRRPPAERLRLLVWCPTPTNPACAEALRGLEGLAAELGLEAPVHLAASGGPLPDELPEVADVLHIVGHGVIEESIAALRLAEERLVAPGPALGLLGTDLTRLSLVTLDVCSGGSPGVGPYLSLASQLLARGAPAVLAPGRPALVEASQAFSRGLYSALSRGEPLSKAVRFGRALVGRLGLAHPAGRAHNMLYYVASEAALNLPALALPGWRPEGWPPVRRDLRELLVRARALAIRERQRHVGVEHLVRALGPSDGGALVQRARHRLISRTSDTQWTQLSPPGLSDGDPTPTPRLSRLLAGHPGSPGLDDLWRALAADPDHGLHVLAGEPLGLTTSTLGPETPLLGGAAPGSGPPATAFQILWGPDDGANLSPEPGQTIGRGDVPDGPDLALWPPGAPWGESQVSRRHLRYDGPGRAFALRKVDLLPGGWPDPVEHVEGPVNLRVGDVLRLGERTWLRAIARS